MKTVFVLSLVTVLTVSSCSSQENTKNESSISSQEKEVVQDVDADFFHEHFMNGQLLDVRTPEEYAEGHIANALNVNYYDANFKDQVSKLDKHKPVYVYCRSGKRSANASEDMKALGFKEIYNLVGGYAEYSYK
jgi:rhodanese-related sulfurtransferase